MIQIRAGDLVAVENDGKYFLALLLSKQVLFGGHWSFVLHGLRESCPSEKDVLTDATSGFHSFIDFISPKRESRLVRIARGIDTRDYEGPEMLQSNLGGERTWIYKWPDKSCGKAALVESVDSASPEQLALPSYSTRPADIVWKLVALGWRPGESIVSEETGEPYLP